MDTTLTISHEPEAQPVPRIPVWARRKLEATKRPIREIVYARHRRWAAVRKRVASKHLTGSGLEIGALHLPLRVPRGVSVSYVDRYRRSELRAHYPELEISPIVDPDIVDDAETLATIQDASVNFVIANHFIEHCEDPIGTIKTFLRVLRPGGVIYMAVPDGRLTFDSDRPITSVDHLVHDHLEGPESSRAQHYEEWTRFSIKVPPSDVAQRAQELQTQGYSIHYHVWTPSAFLELLVEARSRFDLPLDVEAVERNEHEFIVIMSRSAA
jgi:SAM-dependent methyltransferase